MKKIIFTTLVISVLLLPGNSWGWDAQSTHPGELPKTFTISDLYSYILFVVYTGNGTWLVKIMEINSNDIDNAQTIVYDAIQSMPKKLKPFPKRNNSIRIKPKLTISPLTISKQGRPGKIRAWLSADYGINIVLTWNVIKEGKPGIQYAFAHELGHWVWFFILSEADRQEYTELVGKPNYHDQKLINTQVWRQYIPNPYVSRVRAVARTDL